MAAQDLTTVAQVAGLLGNNLQAQADRATLPWQANTVYALNALILDANGNAQLVTTAGTSGGTQPVWNLQIGGTTIDNTVTWTNQGLGILSRMVTSLSSFVLQTVLRRRSVNGQTLLTDTLDGTGSDKMVMKDWPIISVSSLSVFNVAVPASPDNIQAGFVFDERSIILLPSTSVGAPYSLRNTFGKFPRARSNVKVQYFAGYLLANWLALTAFPLNAGLVDSNGNVEQVTTAGTSGATLPVWNTAINGTTTDGSVVWTNRGPGGGAAGLTGTSPVADLTYNGAPADLGYAVTELVVQEYLRRNWKDARAKTLAAGETITTFNDRAWPLLVTRVFETYRRWWYV